MTCVKRSSRMRCGSAGPSVLVGAIRAGRVSSPPALTDLSGRFFLQIAKSAGSIRAYVPGARARHDKQSSQVSIQHDSIPAKVTQSNKAVSDESEVEWIGNSVSVEF